MKSTDASEIQNTILRSKTIAPAAPLLTVPLSFGIPRSMVAGARPMGAIPQAWVVHNHKQTIYIDPLSSSNRRATSSTPGPRNSSDMSNCKMLATSTPVEEMINRGCATRGSFRVHVTSAAGNTSWIISIAMSRDSGPCGHQLPPYCTWNKWVLGVTGDGDFPLAEQSDETRV